MPLCSCYVNIMAHYKIQFVKWCLCTGIVCHVMHAISDVSQPLGTVIDAVESCHVCCQCKVGDHEDRKEEVEEEKEMEEEEGEDE